MQVQTVSTDASRYGDQEVLFTTKKYQNGEMTETKYYRADTVELSDDAIRQTVIPEGSENYNSMMREISSMSLVPHDKMFYETMDIMKDYYAGNIDKEQVQDLYRQYCVSFLGKPGGCMTEAWKKSVTRGLADLYEYFSRANTRAANAANSREGDAIGEEAGTGKAVAYYHAKYYYDCQEMQEMFRRISDEMAEEYGCAGVDFEAVEKNTKFQLDGGITYNGVWDHLNMNASRSGSNRAVEMDNVDFVPPKDFVYYAGRATEQSTAEKLNDRIKRLFDTKKFSNHEILTLLSGQSGKKSLLTEQIGKDKDAPLYAGYDFVKFLSFHNVYDRVESCGIGR